MFRSSRKPPELRSHRSQNIIIMNQWESRIFPAVNLSELSFFIGTTSDVDGDSSFY